MPTTVGTLAREFAYNPAVINVGRRHSWDALLAVALVSATLLTERAFAEPSPQDRALAKQDWTKGKQQLAVKAFDAAAELFAQADARDPKAQYKLDLARADIELGKWVEAASLLETIERLDEPNSEREKAAAKSTLEKLVPRIPVVKLVVEGCSAGDVTASIAGEEVDVGAPVRRNPGRYTVSLHSAHCTAEDKTFSLAEGETYDLKVPFQETNAGATKNDGEDAPKRTGGTMLPAAIAFGVGGASLVVGAIFGGLAYDLTSQLAAVCKGGVCPSKYLPVLETTLAYGNTSTATIVIGSVGVATGIVLAVTVGRGSAAPAKDEKKTSAFIAPYFTWGDGPTGVKGVGVAGAF